MQLFLGLTFNPTVLQFKKIDSFRKRFDQKYSRSHLLQMTLLPPFKVEGMSWNDVNLLSELLADDIEGHFAGMDEEVEVNFNGFDFQTGRKGVLFLKPSMPIDLFHCQEVLGETIKDFGGSFNKEKNLGKSFADDLQTFLPIGRFDDMTLLGQAVDKAKIEFASPFQLAAKNITLFEKLPGSWIPRKVLHTFPLYSQGFVENEETLPLLRSPANLEG